MINTSEQKTYFNDYIIEDYVAEPCYSYNLFESEFSDINNEQLNIISDLEKRFKLYNASSLGSLVHFQNASNIPVQRWFPYREGFSTKLVSKFIDELEINGTVFDPFCGSGTTLLASRLKNLDSIGIDVNPISTLVASVENSNYSNEDIKNLQYFKSKLRNLKEINNTLTTNFELANKVFNKDILNSLLQIREFVDSIKNERIHNLFFMAWLSIIENVSNIKKEGNGIKYKNRKRTPKGYLNIEKKEWETINFPDDKFNYVVDSIISLLNLIEYDLINNYGAIKNIPKVFNSDSLQFNELFDTEIDLTFFSPPYCNCFDYFEIHKVELWLGDFIKSKEELKRLRNKGLRSNTNSLLNKPILYKNDSLERLITLFNPEKLWHKRIPDVVRGYFDDMKSFLNLLYLQTSPNGYVGIVVGNSAYTSVIIPTDLIIADIANSLGFDVENIFITRHLTTSSQQKRNLHSLKEYLRESIILLRK